MTSVKQLLLKPLLVPGFPALLKYVQRDCATVFMLHRFRDPERGIAGCDASHLRRVLAYLTRNGYELVTLMELFERLGGKGPQARGAVAFTIDDGYVEQATVAAPIFAEFGCPVTTFVTTGFLDRQLLWFWWDQIEYIFRHTARRSAQVRLGDKVLDYRWEDDEAARARAGPTSPPRCKMVPQAEKPAAVAQLAHAAEVEVPAGPPACYAPMSWNQVRECEAMGMTFGPHTVTHPVLSRSANDVASYEITESWARLRSEVRKPVPVFCYPYGWWADFGEREVAVLRRLGFLGALAAEPGYANALSFRSSDDDRFKVRALRLPGRVAAHDPVRERSRKIQAVAARKHAMMLVAAFWLSLLAIAYAYIGYPAVLWLLSRFRPPAGRDGTAPDTGLPSVTLIVSAFNEEQVIGQKLENALSLDYPRDLLEIVVVSDGSSDRTCEIALGFAHRGVVLRHYEGRIGKSACLNRALPMASGSIVVFSDANSAYERGALRALVRPFEDPSVGFVTGCTRYGSEEDGGTSASLSLYSKLELVTKQLESRLGSCVGADGAIFAVRKELYTPLRSYDINDLVIPFSINRQGYRGILQREAVCVEKDAGGAKGEFQRQVRITNRTLRAIMNYRQLLNPFRFGWLSFEIFSHKLCRFLVPPLLITALASNLLLAERGGFFLATFVAQGAFYATAGAATLLSKTGFLSRLAETARSFVVINAAIALAWIKYFQGETYTTWSPTKR